jgi:hypothetical protein
MKTTYSVEARTSQSSVMMTEKQKAGGTGRATFAPKFARAQVVSRAPQRALCSNPSVDCVPTLSFPFSPAFRAKWCVSSWPARTCGGSGFPGLGCARGGDADTPPCPAATWILVATFGGVCARAGCADGVQFAALRPLRISSPCSFSRVSPPPFASFTPTPAPPAAGR